MKRTAALLLGAAFALPLSAAEPGAALTLIPEQPYADHRNQPPWTPLTGEAADAYELGHQVFNTSFLPAGTAGAGRRAGVGPLFNGASCDECHNEGAHGRGPMGDGPVPDALVVQLQGADEPVEDPAGDPVYGRTFNPVATPGFGAEGDVRVTYTLITHRYPDGSRAQLRVPSYTFGNLKYGPLAPHTLVKPRIAPPLFGDGLLERAQVQYGPRGRFGWQASALSVRDQTTRALSREMGLSSSDRPVDDCTPAETDCTGQTRVSPPEMSEELLQAVLSFEQWLSVPAPPASVLPDARGEKLFSRVGCSGCHQPRLPAALPEGRGTNRIAQIAPYSDLKLHNLGMELADRDVSGVPHSSAWRTAPLWGLGYRLGRESKPTFLHDGRARSPEEAILWHDGEAAVVRQRFEHLSAADRAALLDFLHSL